MIAALVALAVSMVVAGAAAASYKPGTYKGKTEQGRNIRFKAAKVDVKGIKIKIDVACDDGSTELLTAIGARSTSTGRGSFTAKFESDTAMVLATGKLRGLRASGSAEADSVNDAGSSCRAETTWTARRKKR